MLFLVVVLTFFLVLSSDSAKGQSNSQPLQRRSQSTQVPPGPTANTSPKPSAATPSRKLVPAPVKPKQTPTIKPNPAPPSTDLEGNQTIESEPDDFASTTLGRFEGIRAKKRFGIGISVTPLPKFFVGTGIHAFYVRNSKLYLSMEYSGGKGTDEESLKLTTTSGIEIKKADGSATMMSAFGRYFLGDSLNVLAGVGQRTFKVSYQIQASGTTTVWSGDVTSQSTALLGAVGNHFIWRGGMSLGCDWVSVAIPLQGTETIKLNETSRTEGAGEVPINIKSLGNYYAYSQALTLLNLGISYLW